MLDPDRGWQVFYRARETLVVGEVFSMNGFARRREPFLRAKRRSAEFFKRAVLEVRLFWRYLEDGVTGRLTISKLKSRTWAHIRHNKQIPKCQTAPRGSSWANNRRNKDHVFESIPFIKRYGPDYLVYGRQNNDYFVFKTLPKQNFCQSKWKIFGDRKDAGHNLMLNVGPNLSTTGEYFDAYLLRNPLTSTNTTFNILIVLFSCVHLHFRHFITHHNGTRSEIDKRRGGRRAWKRGRRR